MPRPRTPPSPFRYFNSSPEVIRLVVMMYVRFPLSLRNVEDLLFERGIDLCHETVRHWWNRFGPMFAGEIRRQRVSRMRGFRHWRWHLDEMYVKLNGEMVYLWRGLCQRNVARRTLTVLGAPDEPQIPSEAAKRCCQTNLHPVQIGRRRN